MILPERVILPDELKQTIGSRKLYFWGARHDGYGMCRVFERLELSVDGFIDSSPSLQGGKVMGYPVFMPDEFFQAERDPYYIVITSAFYADEIAEECRIKGLEQDRDFISFTQIQLFDYQIDVSGSCNLRCISCPRGNFPEQPSVGFMAPRVYRKVVEKILAEDPFTGIITLYNWGEPLLHPKLPEIVAITGEYDLLSAISSNLSIEKDFSNTIKSRPTWFRVSLSGWGENYEITHTGGKWDTVHTNMLRLKEWQEKYHPEMIVEVFFHIYKHNNNDDFLKLKEFCDHLNFTLRYRHAALAPLDNIEAVIDKRELSSAAQLAREYQFLGVEEAMALAREQKERLCFYQRFLWITWNLRVAQCMEWYRDDLSLVDKDFLSVPLSEIIAARKNSDFCRRCKEKAMHRCYIVYGDEKLVRQKQSLQGV